MKVRVTPYFTELVYEALLKSFWRKNALARFLRQCKVSDRFMSTWREDETKREFLDRLLPKLTASDAGRKALVGMASKLIEQKTFPDLKNWEDSEDKIRDAHEAIARLRAYCAQQEEALQSEEQRRQAREEFQETQRNIARSQQTLQELSDRLNELGKRLGSAEAGYAFQDWFFDLLDFCEITNRKPYSHDGRQIDGSLTLSGTTYLVELKFTAEQAGATDIDTFYKKVTTKADNTMGLMVSISGFSSVAIREASSDRTPILLMDHAHVYLVLGGVMAMGDVVERIRRHASQTGEAFLPAGEFGGR
jgi:uncharacterized protein YukE